MIIKSENGISLKVSFFTNESIEFKFVDGPDKGKCAAFELIGECIDQYLNKDCIIISDRRNITISKDTLKRILCWKIAKDEATEEFAKMMLVECACCKKDLYCAYTKEDSFCDKECEAKYHISEIY